MIKNLLLKQSNQRFLMRFKLKLNLKKRIKDNLIPIFDFSVGLDAAGKTTILYKLKLGEIVTTIPTIGEFYF